MIIYGKNFIYLTSRRKELFIREELEEDQRQDWDSGQSRQLEDDDEKGAKAFSL